MTFQRAVASGDASSLPGIARALFQLIAWCAFLALLTIALYMALNGFSPLATSLRRLLQVFAFAFVVSSSMGLLLGVVLGPIWPRLWALRFPANWFSVIAALLVAAAVGLAIAIPLLVALGGVAGTTAAAQYRVMAPTAAVLTVIFGLWGTMNVAKEAQLSDAMRALAVKQADEARAREAATEATLQSLESRIRPHFLFNTLNSIAQLTHDDPARAEQLIGDLSALLRSSLDIGHTSTTTLAEEMKLVRHYLDIERARFGDRVRCTIEIPATLDLAAIPPFSIQPLVENAIKHAVAASPDGADIHVAAASDASHLIVTVSDTGPGLGDAATSPGHGLHTLQSRLDAMYGPAATLQLTRDRNETRVILTLPWPTSAPAPA